MATFTNRAIITYNGVSTASNIVTGEILGALTATKTALSGTYSAGDRLTYVVSLVNSGDAPITGVTLSDDLGGYELDRETYRPLTYVEGSSALFVNGLPDEDPATEAADGLVISGFGIPAGGTAIIVYEAEVNGFAPLDEDACITNTVTVTGTGVGTPVTAFETVSAAEGPVLSITKALSPSTVMENGSLTYTFVIENSGNTETEADELTFSDTFSPALTGIAAELDGAALTDGEDYTYSEDTGLFETLPGVITVPAAKFMRNGDGSVGVIPGCVTLTVSGNIR